MYEDVLHNNKQLIIHKKHFNSKYILGMYFTSYRTLSNNYVIFKRYDRYKRYESFFVTEKSNIWKLNRHIEISPKAKYNDCYLHKKKMRKNHR